MSIISVRGSLELMILGILVIPSYSLAKGNYQLTTRKIRVPIFLQLNILIEFFFF